MSIVPSPAEFRRVRAEGNAALSAGVKELMGLVISVIKDCEECVYYHLERCDQEDVDREQVLEALQLAMVGAGSVTVPLLRRAISFMDQLPGLAKPA